MFKSPAFQFYPADWLNNIKLQSCSLQAQGLLINLMCLIHQSSKYGYLLINGFIPSKKMVSHLLRLHHKTYDKALKELFLYGVLKEDKNGVIYCERMIKDEYIRAVRRKVGKLGGNPLLKQKDKQDIKQKSTPLSSHPSFTKEKKRKFDEKEFLIFYSAYPNPASKKDALARWKKLLKSGELPELSIILSAIEKQTAWRKNANGDFRPEWKHPATWLNKGCWEDEIIEKKTPSQILTKEDIDKLNA